jgi:predicted Na+-dependent transporter
VKEFVHDHTKALKMLSVMFLICIPWMKISKAKLAGSFGAVSILNLFIVFLWGFALHIVMLIVNYTGAYLIRVTLAVRKTLVILASTKTLAITLSVISFLPPEIGDAGLMSLPLIVLHLALLLIDSAWVVRWNTNEGKEEEANKIGDDDVSLTKQVVSNGFQFHDTSVNHVTAV